MRKAKILDYIREKVDPSFQDGMSLKKRDRNSMGIVGRKGGLKRGVTLLVGGKRHHSGRKKCTAKDTPEKRL